MNFFLWLSPVSLLLTFAAVMFFGALSSRAELADNKQAGAIAAVLSGAIGISITVVSGVVGFVVKAFS